jgi:hypothetical protein
MSMTSRSHAYARHMDEVFAELSEPDVDYQEYLEWCYLTLKHNNPKQQTTNDNVDQRTDRQEGI